MRWVTVLLRQCVIVVNQSVLSDNTQRVYAAQWRIFTNWCGEMGLRPLPADPLTVARYLAARANAGASIATMRLATSLITKAHQWGGHESPCKDRGVRASLKGWGRRLAKPQRQAGALTADTLAVQPRLRGRGFETAEQADERGKFDVALVAVLSDAGLRRSEASSLTWGDVQRWDDGSGRITVVRSKTDIEMGRTYFHIRISGDVSVNGAVRTWHQYQVGKPESTEAMVAGIDTRDDG